MHIKNNLLACGLMVAAIILVSSQALATCTPSKWGVDDEIGSANTITPERVLAATKLVKQGKTQHLGIVVDSEVPAFGPRGLSVTILQPGFQWGNRPFPNGMIFNDDMFTGWLGIGSQIDSLGHIGHLHDGDATYYNCNDGAEISKTTGMTKLGIEKIPPFVARGIVLDMAGLKGVDHLNAGDVFTVEDVEKAAAKQGVQIGEGDVVLFHTGWTDNVLPKDPETWVSGEPGIAEEVATYLAEKNVLAVGADTWGLDPIPPHKDGRPFQGHITLIKENGIYILEVMNTGALIKDGVNEFLFVLGPSRLRGAVQAIIDPIAMY